MMRRVGAGILFVVLAGLLIFSRQVWQRLQQRSLEIDELQQEHGVLRDEHTQLQQRYAVDIKERNDHIDHLEETLAGLQDAEKLKQLLTTTRERLSHLNGEYTKISQAKATLEESNLRLQSRVSNLTRELTHTIEDLKSAKQQLLTAQNNATIQRHKAEVEQYKELLRQKEDELVQLESKLSGHQQTVEESNEETQQLQNKIRDLTKEKRELMQKLDKVAASYEKKYEPISKLKDRIRELERLVAAKDQQRVHLQQAITGAEGERKELELKFIHAQELLQELQDQAVRDMQASQEDKKEIERLKKEKTDLSLKLQKAELRLNMQTQELQALQEEFNLVREKLTQISDERQQLAQDLKGDEDERDRLVARLSSSPQGVDDISVRAPRQTEELREELHKAYALYDTAKAQVVKFSELVIDREMELDRMKERVASLESELYGEGIDAQSMRSLQQRIEKLGQSVEEKERLLQKKDEHISSLEKEYNDLKQEFARKEANFQEAKDLSEGLKSQVVLVAEVLAQREADLLEKDRAVAHMQADLKKLEADLQAKQEELEQLREWQALTLEELARAHKLNTVRQNRKENRQGENSDQEIERQKADALRRKVEQLLGR